MTELTHVLFANARSYRLPHIVELAPPGAVYDESAGAWRMPGSEYILVDDPDEKPRPPTTKKMDRETGEDQKGE